MPYDTFIGVDPGKSGGIAIISKDVHVTKMPLAGEAIDIAALADWLYIKLEFSNPVAYIEKVHSMPRQGVSSTFKFGYTVGVLHGIISTMMIPMHLVSPQLWKKSVLVDTAKDKAAAIEFCRRVYPQVSIIPVGGRAPHIGIADALCIAHYAYGKHKNE